MTRQPHGARRLLRLVMLLALSLTLYSARAAPYVHPQTQVAFPDLIAGMPRIAIQDYEARNPGAGISVRYGRPELYADVFVYTAGIKDIPADVKHPILQQLRQATDRDIATAAKVRGQDLRHGESRTVTVDTAKGHFSILFDSYVIRTDSALDNTFTWLWPARGHFFKIRLTRKAGDHDPKSVREFYETAVRLSIE